jgi:hypothetical protein
MDYLVCSVPLTLGAAQFNCVKNCTKNLTECLWDSLSELRSCVCERRMERTVLSPALLPVKTTQFTQFFPQV